MGQAGQEPPQSIPVSPESWMPLAQGGSVLALLLDEAPPLPLLPPEAPPLATELPPLDPSGTLLLVPPSLLEPPLDVIPPELEPPLPAERLELAELPPIDEEPLP
jgi:hypothetical protein